jgi:hypothetical protein
MPYEIAVQQIFQEIHDRESPKATKVERNVKVHGREAVHQIDVLWEFTVAGIRHKTIVQAKDWSQRVKQEQLLAFRGILDDIPGQPRGVIVTRMGFQKGAKEFANAHGIRLFMLRQGSLEIKLTDIGYAEAKVVTFRNLDDSVGVVLHITVFRPEPHIELTIAPGQKKPDWSDVMPYDMILVNAGKEPIGTVRDILAEFVKRMRQSKELGNSFDKQFTDPTFIKKAKAKRMFRLQSIKATINIVKQ